METLDWKWYLVVLSYCKMHYDSFPGDDSHWQELREKVADEFVRHNKAYAEHPAVLKISQSTENDLINTFFMIDGTLKINGDISEAIKVLGEESRKPGHWSSLIRVLALSTVLQM